MTRTTFRTLLVASSIGVLGAIAGRAQAQAVISGKVLGATQEKLGGAIVTIDELGISVATNSAGAYAMTIPADKAHGQSVTMRVRFIGYTPTTVTLALSVGTHSQDFQLKPDPFRLSEVVVTGVAGETEQKKLTFAVGHVDEAQLQEAPGVNALGALNGKVAAVRTIQASGEPGSAPAIRLRSATSLTSTQDPLVIVDGTITRATLADISGEDIERIEVVKGAAASSLYGSDAANGVVQIFTKRGQSLADGRLTVSVRNEFGESFRPKTIPMAVDHPYAVDPANPCVFLRDNLGNRYIDTSTVGGRLPGVADHPYCNVHDQQAEVLTHGPFVTNYVSVGQRKGNTNFNVSFQNTHQDGIILLLKGYNRKNFRVNLDQALTPRLDLSVGGFFGRSDNNEIQQGPGSPFFAVTFVEPNVNLFAPNPDGSPYAAKIPDRAASNASNPLYYLKNTPITTDRTRFTGFGRAHYRFNDWLSAEANYNYDQETSAHNEFQPLGFLNSDGFPTTGHLIRNDHNGHSFNWGTTITGVRDLSLGSWGRMRNTTKAAFIYEDQKISDFNLTANTVNIVGIPEFQATSNYGGGAGSQDIAIRNRNVYIVSSFDIRDRYILDGLYRRDGSSLFGSLSRYQNYYRISGAWRVSEDIHIPNIDELRLRASYGTAGLRPQFNAQYTTYAIAGGTPVKQNLGNPNLRPARSGETELGVNVDFLRRFSLEYSYSRKLTRDEILLVPLSAATGFQNQWRNAGTLRGQTHELTLQAILANRPNLYWSLNIAGDRTRQQVVNLFDPIAGRSLAPFTVGPGYAGPGIFLIKEGETFGVIYGTRTVRDVNQLYDDPIKAALSGPGQTWSRDSVMINEEGYVVRKNDWRTVNERPIAYVDPTGNSIVKIGDANPSFNLSFTSTLRWKNFSLYGLLDWTQGGNIYNGTRQWPFFENRDRIYDQASKPVAARKTQSYYNFFYNSINPIDFFVESGTWVKIKEINLSYIFNHSTLEGWGIHWFDNIRLGVIGRNLFTFTKYSGYDPEVADLSGDAFSFRFDGFSYPNFRTFTGVVELGF